MGEERMRFDFERLDVFGVALDAVAILDELAEELPDGRGYIREQLRRQARIDAPNAAGSAGAMRGMDRARGEWAVVCTCHNVRKLWVAR